MSCLKLLFICLFLMFGLSTTTVHHHWSIDHPQPRQQSGRPSGDGRRDESSVVNGSVVEESASSGGDSSPSSSGVVYKNIIITLGQPTTNIREMPSTHPHAMHGGEWYIISTKHTQHIATHTLCTLSWIRYSVKTHTQKLKMIYYDQKYKYKKWAIMKETRKNWRRQEDQCNNLVLSFSFCWLVCGRFITILLIIYWWLLLTFQFFSRKNDK